MMERHPLRIAVLMGGVSAEREVSLHSGEAIVKGLREAGQRAFPIVLDSPSLPPLPRDEIDVVFVALHGSFGEDGKIQELLEQEGIPYTGSGVDASRKAMDKLTSKKLFSAAGIPTPPFAHIQANESWVTVEDKLEDLRCPVVVKPRAQGSSIGVSIVRNPSRLSQAIFDARQHDPDILMEKYIPGRELTVGILGPRALPVVEVKPRRDFFDYTAKYQKGETIYIVKPDLKEDLTLKLQELALRAHQALGCQDFSRVDFMLSIDRQPYVLEVNSIPGFTETSLLPKAAQAEGISFAQLCRLIAREAVARAGRAATPIPILAGLPAG